MRRLHDESDQVPVRDARVGPVNTGSLRGSILGGGALLRILVLTGLALLLLASPVSAEVDADVATSEGVLLESDSPGTVEISVDYWNSDAARYETVEEMTGEVGDGRYFFAFEGIEDAGRYRVALDSGSGVETLGFTHRTSSDALGFVDQFSADSVGPTVLLTSASSTLAEVDVLLLNGDGRVIDTVSFDEKDPVIETVLERSWNVPLEEGKGYASAALFTKDGRTYGRQASFTAESDALISTLSPDENGATATIEGDSQVPLNGDVEIVLRSGGEEVRSLERSVEELTAGEERGVTVYWEDVLDPGTYTVEATLESGTVLDAERASFEVEHDGEITDVSGAGIGAAVTVEGRSDLPLDGDIKIKLSRDGELVRTETMPAPVVLSGNEESVDTEWGSRLQSGRYVLVAELITEQGVIDRYGETFEVRSLSGDSGSEGEASGDGEGGPMSRMPAAGAALALAAVLSTAYFVRR